MDKEFERSQNNKAWTMTIAVWLAGVMLLYVIHALVGEISSRDLRWWIDAGLYVVGFLYFLAIGALHDLFLKWVYRRSSQA